MTTLDEIADALEAEWYGAPQLHDWRHDPKNPRRKAVIGDKEEK